MIALGTPVTYHHRAAVARHLPDKSARTYRKGWVLYEGVGVHEMSPHEPLVDLSATFQGWPTRGRINKTIMIWPESGSGVVTGRVKRGIGESQSGYTSSGGGGFEPDYEPGYFAAREWFWLYCVRWALNGTEYVLVPEWALSPVVFEEERSTE